MKVASFFAGIGGFDLGLSRAGHEIVYACEIDPFARSVYAARFGQVPRGEDIERVKAEEIPDADLWCGGFPCQDLSTAGKRAGITAGARSGLVWRFLDLAAVRKPEWILLENVPGLLNGRDDEDDGEPAGAPAGRAGMGAAGGPVSWFGAILGALAELGYVGAWRVLDARHFGVPQRRRRVFLLARRAGNGPDPGEVLLEPEGRRRDLAASRAAGPRASAGAARGAHEFGGFSTPLGSRTGGARGDPWGSDGSLIPETARALTARNTVAVSQRDGDGDVIVAEPGGFYPTAGAHSSGDGGQAPAVVIPFDLAQLTHPENRSTCRPGDPAPTLTASNASRAHSIVPEGGQGADLAPALTATDGARTTDRGVRIVTPAMVRRLTPTECERLMGLPDGWTAIPGASDSHRYKVLGNSVAVPVVEWIGRRLAAAEGRACLRSEARRWIATTFRWTPYRAVVGRYETKEVRT